MSKHMVLLRGSALMSFLAVVACAQGPGSRLAGTIALQAPDRQAGRQPDVQPESLVIRTTTEPLSDAEKAVAPSRATGMVTVSVRWPARRTQFIADSVMRIELTIGSLPKITLKRPAPAPTAIVTTATFKDVPAGQQTLTATAYDDANEGAGKVVSTGTSTFMVNVNQKSSATVTLGGTSKPIITSTFSGYAVKADTLYFGVSKLPAGLCPSPATLNSAFQVTVGGQAAQILSACAGSDGNATMSIKVPGGWTTGALAVTAAGTAADPVGNATLIDHFEMTPGISYVSMGASKILNLKAVTGAGAAVFDYTNSELFRLDWGDPELAGTDPDPRTRRPLGKVVVAADGKSATYTAPSNDARIHTDASRSFDVITYGKQGANYATASAYIVN